MNKVLRQYIKKFIQIYLDDIIIYLNNLKNHKKYIKIIFEKIRETNLKLKSSKYQQFQLKLIFIKYQIRKNRIRSDL